MAKGINCGGSLVTPYVPAHRLRHRMRHQVATEMYGEADGWCRKHGVVLARIRDGREWAFNYRGRLARWNAYDARLVIGARTWHAHDWYQVRSVLREQWSIEDRILVGPILPPRRKHRRRRKGEWH